LTAQSRLAWRFDPADGICCFVLGPVQINYRAQEPAAMAQRHYADLFEVLMCQISKDGKIDVVLGTSHGAGEAAPQVTQQLAFSERPPA
jgi:hypothetical protein